ncbi:MAG: alpha-L-glutamate ligase-like protein [Cycloclasticus sp.]|nr:alpha-L-glutamate ligase-like protein [Cycloclasticus sp.]MBQ0789531.1 alpha-L-glutamate ligase-like protein [Cycloclasticus sp.]
MKWISPSQLRQLGVLGMNSRNIDYIGRSNNRSLFPLVDDKLKTKKLAEKFGMSVPQLFTVINNQHDIQLLETQLSGRDKFVIKPAQGSGGKGILVISERDGDRYIKSSGASLELRDLKHHATNILSGLFSLGGRPDVVMIEDMIVFDPIFSHYSYEGVPDIRVIVYKGYPVMAMLRCSTHESDGKANLHQGAVGVGIDMGTGKSLFAVQNNIKIQKHPNTGFSFDDLIIPGWDHILHLASRCYEMVGLGYFGADIVLDKNKGPMILELNARPGLAIQVANQAGLAKRLKLIDQYALSTPHDVDQRVALSKQLFAKPTANV